MPSPYNKRELEIRDSTDYDLLYYLEEVIADEKKGDPLFAVYDLNQFDHKYEPKYEFKVPGNRKAALVAVVRVKDFYET